MIMPSTPTQAEKIKEYLNQGYELFYAGEEKFLVNYEKLIIRHFNKKKKSEKTPYRYRSLEQLKLRLNERINDAKNWQKQKERKEQKQKEEREELIKTIEVGSIFYTSWGYEQTNVDFYQVIEKKGKSTVIIKAIASERVEEVSYYSDRCKPVKDAFLDEESIEKRINKHGCLRMTSYSSASLVKDEKETFHRSWGY